MNSTSEPQGVSAEVSRSMRRRLVLSWCGVAVVVVAGLAQLQSRMLAQEAHHWAQELELGAMRHAQQLSDVSHRQLTLVNDMANNVSVQLYMTQVQRAPAETLAGATPLPERQYLENMLMSTASKAGFQPPSSFGGAQKTNVTQPLQAGMALLDAAGKPIASTRAMPTVTGTLAAFVSNTSAMQPSMSSPVAVAEDVYALYFQAPIFAVQSDPAPENRIGRVVGVRLLDARLLKAVFANEDAAQATAIATGAQQSTLLQLQNGELLAFDVSANAEAERAALDAPGTLIRAKDHHGWPSFMVAVRVPESEMLIVQSIAQDVALADASAQLRWMWAFGVLGLAALAVVLWAMVRHGAALRAALSVEHYQQLTRRLENQTRLLSVVTENTPNTLTIVDDLGRLCFTNRAGDMDLSAVQGKTMVSVYGADAAQQRWAYCQHVLEFGATEVAADIRETSRGERNYQCVYIPLATIPVDLKFLSPNSRGVLIIEEDVTELEQERARQERTLNAVVDCLVGLVDSRDPFAAQHSQQVARVAERVAAAMGLPDVLQETAALAGKLLNVGKMHVPEEVLARAGALDAGAMAAIREALLSSANVVANIAFRGPVAETIRQSLERVDGSGPHGLKGDVILMPARIVAAANAFVGMTSARAYRAPLSIEAATTQLMQAAGSVYDASVVAALVHGLSQQPLEKSE